MDWTPHAPSPIPADDLSPFLKKPWEEHPALRSLFTEDYLESESNVVVAGIGRSMSQLNEIQPGYYLGGEDAFANRGSMQWLGVKLIINMCASPEMAANPYKKFDTTTQKHVDCANKTEFLSLLDLACRTPLTQRDNAEGHPLLVLYVAADDCTSYDISQHLSETCEVQEIVLTMRRAMESFAASPAWPAWWRTHLKKSDDDDDDDVPRLIPPAVGVHCMAGVSRSATVVIAYLMKKCRASRDDVLTAVHKRRSIVHPNNGFMNALLLFEHSGYERMASRESIPGIVAHLTRSTPIERVGFLRSMVAVVLTHKLDTDRRMFGPLVMALLSVPSTALELETGLEPVASPLTKVSEAKRRQNIPTTAADVANVLVMTISDYVRAQEYIDSVRLFDWWCELTHSIATNAPVVVYAAALDEETAEIADGGACGAAWSDSIHCSPIRDILRDVDNDCPLNAVLSFLTSIAEEYHRKVWGGKMAPAPTVVFAHGDIEADPSCVEVVRHSAFETFRTSFPHSHFLCLAALRNVVVDRLTQEAIKRGCGSDHNQQQQQQQGRSNSTVESEREAEQKRALEDVALQKATAAELKAILSGSVLAEDIEAFVLLALVTNERAASAAPMLVETEWDKVIGSLKAEHETSALVTKLVCAAAIRKLATALTCGAVLLAHEADPPHLVGEPSAHAASAGSRRFVKLAVDVLRRCVSRDRPDEASIIDDVICETVAFFEEGDAPLLGLDIIEDWLM